jgi:hypothetical protein
MIKSFIKSILSKLGKRNPELLVRIRYLLRFGKRLNLDNPVNLNEKILYLSLRTDTAEWTRLSDKYQVRDYLRECGLESLLNRLYGVWDSVDEIDFGSLPDKFVIKTTHGCNDTIVVNDRKTADIDKIKKETDASLHRTWGLSEGTIHYSRIKPRVIVEELLENDAEAAKYSTSLIDYKVWCFDGKAEYILTCTDRKAGGTSLMTYDKDWMSHPEYMVFSKHHPKARVIPKPDNLDRMIELAQKLAAPFPVVRVDFYDIAGRIIFGEMTFTSLGGLMDYYTDDFLRMAGQMIHIQ